MSWWEAVVLGVVQGLTEFFPVSSSGHLVLSESLLGLSIPGVAFDVALHVATLVSVVVVYRARLWGLFLGCFVHRDVNSWRYVGLLALATVPAAVAGLTFEDWFEARFEDPIYAGTMILVTGCFVWSTRWARGEQRSRALEFLPIVVAAVVSYLAGTVVPFTAVLAAEALLMSTARRTAPAAWAETPGWSGAAFMGVAQAMAIMPGISRSGSTVVTGLWRRIDPVAAAEFSFLMSIPAILGAAVLKLPELTAGGGLVGALPLLLGSVAALLAGILAIRFFVALLKRQEFWYFAVYCWVAGAGFLLMA
ncbi:MAG: undecaprenyl-diphosphate phosphatase [Gemmatimonadota bacterium]